MHATSVTQLERNEKYIRSPPQLRSYDCAVAADCVWSPIRRSPQETPGQRFAAKGERRPQQGRAILVSNATLQACGGHMAL